MSVNTQKKSAVDMFRDPETFTTADDPEEGRRLAAASRREGEQPNHQGPPPAGVKLSATCSAVQRFYYPRNVTGFFPKQPATVKEDMKTQSREADEIIRARDAPKVVLCTMKDISVLKARREEGEEGEGTTATGETEGKTKEGEIQIVPHQVGMDDSYARLALRYHTTVKVIKKWNRIHKPLSYMIGRILEIPSGATYIDRSADPSNEKVVLQQLVKAFRTQTERKCDRLRCEYYLKNNDLDLKKALAEFKEDEAWEQQQTTGPLAEMKTEEAKAKTPAKRPNIWQQLKRPQKQAQQQPLKHNVELQTVAVSSTYL